MPKFKDLVGQRFDRWVVMHRGEDYTYPTSGKTAIRWVCKCDCGVEKLVHSAHLLNGSSKSCGCLSSEISRTHGLSSTREYKSWCNMIKRCTNPSKKDSNHYLALGISVCDRWLSSVENFIEDMGECPDGFELERVDCSLGYFPENCKWASESEQSQNRKMFSSNTSGKTGVVWCKVSKMWRVFLQYNKVKHCGGSFKNFEDAVSKRKQLEIDVLGREKPY